MRYSMLSFMNINKFLNSVNFGVINTKSTNCNVMASSVSITAGICPGFCSGSGSVAPVEQ